MGNFYDDASAVFVQKFPHGIAGQIAGQAYWTFIDEYLSTPTQRNKGMHIFVKRGSGADYTAKPGSPVIAEGTRLAMAGQTWDQFRLTPPTQRLW